MKNKINVFMLGKIGKKVPNTSSCGLSEIKGQNATEFEVFNELKDFLLNSDIKNLINLSFVNIDDEVELEDLEKTSIEKYGSPIISIDKKEVIVGKIQNVNVYMTIKKYILSKK